MRRVRGRPRSTINKKKKKISWCRDLLDSVHYFLVESNFQVSFFLSMAHLVSLLG